MKKNLMPGLAFLLIWFVISGCAANTFSQKAPLVYDPRTNESEWNNGPIWTKGSIYQIDRWRFIDLMDLSLKGKTKLTFTQIDVVQIPKYDDTHRSGLGLVVECSTRRFWTYNQFDIDSNYKMVNIRPYFSDWATTIDAGQYKHHKILALTCDAAAARAKAMSKEINNTK